MQTKEEILKGLELEAKLAIELSFRERDNNHKMYYKAFIR